MTENNEKTVLLPECGPHCGSKDGYLGHCEPCHQSFYHVEAAVFPHPEHYIGGVGFHFCNGIDEVGVFYDLE